MKVLVKLGMVACLAVVGSLLAGVSFSVGADVGKKAPAFQGVDENGKVWKSSDHVGKKVVVLYFYPADFTGGCTAQACGYRDNLDKLTGKDVEVVGISGDTPKTHAMFKKYHKLNFTLLADEDGSIAKKFGLMVNTKGGSANGFDFEGKAIKVQRPATITPRTTVIIDKKGNIAANYKVGNAGGDSKTVLETIDKLASK